MSKPQGIIILTSGLSGSSVTCNLIAQAGYWTGDKTQVKPDYDTHENSQLVSLNERLLKYSGFVGDHTKSFNKSIVDCIGGLYDTIDLKEYREFIDACDHNKKWIWKDPLLCYTIKFWVKLLDQHEFKCIFLDRSSLQRWISVNLRRKIQSYDYCRDYSARIKITTTSFLNSSKIEYFDLFFDDLLMDPLKTLKELGDFLDIELSIEDLKSVYHKKLQRNSHGIKGFFIATLIYIKNYRYRNI